MIKVFDEFFGHNLSDRQCRHLKQMNSIPILYQKFFILGGKRLNENLRLDSNTPFDFQVMIY